MPDAERLDLACRRGATFSRTLTYTDSAGQPVNLTGVQIEVVIDNGTGDPVLTLGNTAPLAGVVVSAPLTGVFVVTLTDEQTADLDRNVYRWQAFLPASGAEEILLFGFLTVSGGDLA